MDILREISVVELDYIIERLRDKLPYAIKDLYYILGAKRSKELSKSYKDSEISVKLLPTFYTHRNGNTENCTIFGITGEQDHTVWFFTFQDSLDELRECLEQTKFIRWTEGILFVTIHEEHTGPIFDCIEKFDYKLGVDDKVCYYWLSQEDALKFDIE